MHQAKHAYFCALIALFFWACKKDNNDPNLPNVSGAGAYVTNEGNFMNNNASISFISADGVVSEDPYFDRNGVPIGDVCTSLALRDGIGCAVLNNSQKLVVFDASTFAHARVIEGFSYPRHILMPESGTAYVTDGAFAGFVRVVNTTTGQIEQSIAVGNGPERMAISGGLLFVANSGGWTTDQTVSVIDMNTHNVVATVNVSDRPVALVTDASGMVWALCSGEVLYDEFWNVTGHTPARLHRIDPSDFSVSFSAVVGEEGDHPQSLSVSPDGQSLYYIIGGIRRLETTALVMPGELVVSGAFSSVNVHPQNGSLWTTSVSNFVSNSTISNYTTAGQLIRTFNTGIGANGVYWR